SRLPVVQAARLLFRDRTRAAEPAARGAGGPPALQRSHKSSRAGCPWCRRPACSSEIAQEQPSRLPVVQAARLLFRDRTRAAEPAAPRSSSQAGATTTRTRRARRFFYFFTSKGTRTVSFFTSRSTGCNTSTSNGLPMLL